MAEQPGDEFRTAEIVAITVGILAMLIALAQLLRTLQPTGPLLPVAEKGPRVALVSGFFYQINIQNVGLRENPQSGGLSTAHDETEANITGRNIGYRGTGQRDIAPGEWGRMIMGQRGRVRRNRELSFLGRIVGEEGEGEALSAL
ncbi:hypothetical protein C7212DRAFT_343553 [Tuber magnatum]|uniref:Uncharacterized protein n=1 Tax=Tuber magnatum TaxID=42249 RepID=A0A317SPR4_9PEZI|nr:hypothetical protein C7212DRAFT_343553 [Tuber magnatum]